MLKFIENLLSAFRSCFSRTRTYEWFLIIVSALLVRYDSLGVTSFVRALSLDHRFYETMLHFFRSSAYKTADLKTCWHKIIHRNAPLIRIGGRPLLLGDGCKVCKESRRMPGVKKLCQESENSSKPQFIHGHMFGGIGTAIGNHLNSFCIPMDLTIQDGLKETVSWTGRSLSSSGKETGKSTVSQRADVQDFIPVHVKAAEQIHDLFIIMEQLIHPQDSACQQGLY